MKHNEHEVQVVVDGTPLEEFNVDEKFDTVTNTWTYTGEIAYTHDKNFQFQMLYTAQKQGHGVKYDAYVDGQAACDLIVIGKLDEVTTECIEGFEQPGSVRPFRWTRLGLRQNAPVSSDSEPPSDVGTLSMLLKPRRNCVYTGNPFTAYSDKPFNPAARSPSSTAIKFAIVTCDDPIASRFITIDSRPDRTRPRVVMRWTYMLRDLIVEKRRQGVQESAGREGKAPTAAGVGGLSIASRSRVLSSADTHI
ncbi:hypothetical protein IE81DRAFT_206308 [Ceraceosorus guamensis]|uniref:Uncharacterized protein n=1 Tax=Ceraceosorus guamensis TaxID=1522189 RepID=A0A316W698_9BASI|nr:hypothetical protein IE81DRAFT_206308 [Ceraceosorus guamensis]PWN45154.1 hypothetical protein IE81DRAFT_206308 [Ceraceosorus guamensis]